METFPSRRAGRSRKPCAKCVGFSSTCCLEASMPSLPSPESYLTATNAALESLPLLRRAIRGKAEVYGAIYPFALAGCVVTVFFDMAWIRWLACFLIAVCLFTSWSMRGTFRDLALPHRFLQEGTPAALANHRTLNYAALALLSYAWIGILRSWPAPSFAVLVAASINFMHYCGYPERPGDR